MNRELERPEGLALSPNHKSLYVGDTVQKKTWVFAIQKDGELGTKLPFCNVAGAVSVDLLGNVYIVVGESIVAFNRDGGELGRLAVPATPQRCLLVGRKMSILTANHLYGVETNSIGCRLVHSYIM